MPKGKRQRIDIEVGPFHIDRAGAPARASRNGKQKPQRHAGRGDRSNQDHKPQCAQHDGKQLPRIGLFAQYDPQANKTAQIGMV